MAFINFSDIPLMDVAYVVSAIVLLPINSALNPILYSDVFDNLYNKIRLRVSSSTVWKSTSKQETSRSMHAASTSSKDTKL